MWRFADCEFDERRRELRVGGAVVDIEAKPLDLLHQLLLHAGEVVTKDELLDAVWPGLTVVDGSLATAVSKLRKALGDDSIVLTLPRVGYRLAVPAHVSGTTAPITRELHLAPGEPVPGRDQWRLDGRIEHSPSSEVWRAVHPKTRETRIFKFASDDTQLKGLKREVTIARLLRESLGDRPDFVRVLEWNFDAPPYFVESEEGGVNLADWAAAQGGLAHVPLDERCRVLADVASAVAAAHGLDVLHKDLKPGNVLIARTPDGAWRVKVSDFGSSALLVPARLGALGITNLGFTPAGAGEAEALTGTMLYVAPEVLAGQSPTPASDVYALGVLLYQLVIGDFRKPLSPGWEAEVADAVLREDIAAAACGDPARRVPTAIALEQRLRSLEARRAERRRTAASRRWRWRAVAASVLAVAVLATAALFLPRRPADASPSATTVAVLPFQNVSGDPAVDFLRLGLADEVATMLSRIRSLSVRPVAASSRYGQPGVDLQQVGRDLRASRLVSGRFVQNGDRLRVTIEVVDPDTSRLLRQDAFDVAATALVEMQVQLAARTRDTIVPALGAAATDTTAIPRDETAYMLFLRSTTISMADEAANPRAIEMLERSVELDPTYPPAWISLARRYYVVSRYQTGDPRMMDKFESSAARARALDPASVAADASLTLAHTERGDLAGALKEARDLVRRRPDTVESHFVLSYVLRYAGLIDEATHECDTAYGLDRYTRTVGLRSCAVAFILRGDFARARDYIQLEYGTDWARALTIHTLVGEGRKEEALRITPPHVPQWNSYDVLLACLANRPAGDIAALTAAVHVSDDPETNYFSAAHLAYCGQHDAALTLLEPVVQSGYCAYPAIETDPLLKSLRGTPGFAAIRAAAMACQRKVLAAASSS